MESKNIPDYLKNGVAEVELSYKPSSKYAERINVLDSRSAYSFFSTLFDEGSIGWRESFYVCALNRVNQIVAYHKVSDGGTAGTSVDPKIVLTFALKTNAHGIILCHNHPSGSVKPSSPDMALTKKIRVACQMLDIQLLDHVILSPDGNYYSFSDQGDL